MSAKYWTYQELGTRFNVHPKTVYRWFRAFEKFEPNERTVRVPQETLDAFLRTSTKK